MRKPSFKVLDIVEIRQTDKDLLTESVYIQILAIRRGEWHFEYYVQNHPELHPIDADRNEIEDSGFDFTECVKTGGFKLFGGWDLEVTIADQGFEDC